MEQTDKQFDAYLRLLLAFLDVIAEEQDMERKAKLLERLRQAIQGSLES